MLMTKSKFNKKNTLQRILFTVCIICTVTFSLFAQQNITVTGVVTDENSQPLSGVSVVVDGSTTIGAVTSAEGRFSINVPDETSVLVLSFLGYVTQSITVGNQRNISVSLVEDTNYLDDVVVVGYGTQRKATLTGAIVAIKSEEIVLTKNENVVNMMSGKLPGVRVWQRSAEPGNFDRTKFDIRGFGDPLIVIDGVPQGNEVFNRIDPNEIDNISILKDGAAAIYGVRAANGVILVTTKRGGGTGKFRINYSYNHGWQKFLYMPDNVNAIDYMILQNEKLKRSFDGNFLSQSAPLYNESDFAPFLSGEQESVNWSKETMRETAGQFQHNLSINGENNKIQYFFNLGYMNQDGIFQSGDMKYNRWNFRSNNTINIFDNLRGQVNLSGYLDNKMAPRADMWTIFKAAWNIPPVYQVFANNNPNYYDNYRNHDNPVAWQDASTVGYRDNKKRDVQAQGVLEWDLPWVKGLKLKGMYNYHFNHSTENDYRHAYYLYEYRPDADPDREGTYLSTAYQSPSYSAENYWESVNTLFQVSASYSNTFFERHSVDALLLYEESSGEGKNFSAQRNIELEIPYIAAGVDTDQRGSGGFPWRNVRKAIVGKLNYAYAGKYMLDFSFRNDGSSVFSPKKRWGFFPGVSVAWRLSEESFIRDNIAFLNHFKLRASYGVMGDDSALSYQHISGYNYPNNGYIMNGMYINGVQTRGMTNEDLTWYTSKTVNYGFEFDLWKGLLGGSFDYFVRNRDGLFATRLAQFPGSVGVGLPQENLNSDRNFGYELTLTHRNKIRDVDYHLNANVTYARHMNRYVEQNPFGNSYDEWRNKQSDRYTYSSIWWGRDYVGQFQNYDQIYNHPINTGGGNQSVVPGDYYYADWNGDGFVDGQDDHPIASYNMPLINFGLTIGANWKGIDFSALFQGASMFYVQYEEQYREPLMYGSGSAMVRFLDRWHTVNPGDDIFDPNTQWIPGYYATMGSGLEEGTRAVRDASYVRLKSLELGYTFPKQWTQKVKIDALRVYVNGYNLLTFTGLDNYDPEHPGSTVNGDNWDNSQGGYYYPNNKTFNIGVSITF
jgi:TonB-linked SusC/RagA family outer membrane protein